MDCMDIISHKYFDIDEEVIFNVCDNNLNPLSETISKILGKLKESKLANPK